jgi:hypothetical protein
LQVDLGSTARGAFVLDPRVEVGSAHDRMTPTLMRSPRSTRGTTRMIA